MIAARARLALAAENADLTQVAHGAGNCGAADLKLLGQLCRGEPPVVVGEQRDEYQCRHPRHAGVDECGREAFHELLYGSLVATCSPRTCVHRIVNGM